MTCGNGVKKDTKQSMTKVILAAAKKEKKGVAERTGPEWEKKSTNRRKDLHQKWDQKKGP